MDVQITANIGECNQLRQMPGPSKRDFTAILPHFRRDHRESELMVDLLFARAGNPPSAGEQAVFVELPAVVVR